MPKCSRRDFLKDGTLVAVGLSVPAFLTACDALKPGTPQPPVANGNNPPAGPTSAPPGAAPPVASKNILIAIQLAGGNDGLNTVIPYSNDNYRKLRPTLAIPDDQIIKLTDAIGWHPNLAPLKPYYDAGQVAIVQGVEYPNPNRSHFRGIEIWQTANPDAIEKYGWLGRYLDASGIASPLTAFNIGVETPRTLLGQKVPVPSTTQLSNFALSTDTKYPQDRDAKLAAFTALYNAAPPGRYGDLLRQTATSAVLVTEELQKKVAAYKSTVQYPQGNFAQGLKQLAQVIQAEQGMRIGYVTLGGFDTHANEKRTHDDLMKDFAEGVAAFMEDMKQLGKADDVVLMTFSEFGRRVKENGSAGTDHGTAEPMFLLGGKVKGGLYGDHPSLTDLKDNDLKYQIDFRTIYATILEKWLTSEPDRILGSRFDRLPLFA